MKREPEWKELICRYVLPEACPEEEARAWLWLRGFDSFAAAYAAADDYDLRWFLDTLGAYDTATVIDDAVEWDPDSDPEVEVMDLLREMPVETIRERIPAKAALLALRRVARELGWEGRR